MADAKQQSNEKTADAGKLETKGSSVSGEASAQKVADAVDSGASAEPAVEAIAKAVKADAPTENKVKAKAETSEQSTKKVPSKEAVSRKAPAKKAATRKSPSRAASSRRSAASGTPKTNAPAATSKSRTPSITALKETIMATKKTDTNAAAMDMATDMQERAQETFSKMGEFASEAGEFNKANVEAMVESGQIWFSGAQDLVRENMESGKTVFETMTEDAKKIASAKSPTEFMQMQSEMARRSFDSMMSFGSERTEAWVKLYNEAFAPISNRASVAAEKMSKVAA